MPKSKTKTPAKVLEEATKAVADIRKKIEDEDLGAASEKNQAALEAALRAETKAQVIVEQAEEAAEKQQEENKARYQELSKRVDDFIAKQERVKGDPVKQQAYIDKVSEVFDSTYLDKNNIPKRALPTDEEFDKILNSVETKFAESEKKDTPPASGGDEPLDVVPDNDDSDKVVRAQIGTFAKASGGTIATDYEANNQKIKAATGKSFWQNLAEGTEKAMEAENKPMPTDN